MSLIKYCEKLLKEGLWVVKGRVSLHVMGLFA